MDHNFTTYTWVDPSSLRYYLPSRQLLQLTHLPGNIFYFHRTMFHLIARLPVAFILDVYETKTVGGGCTRLI
jgi:hypothetical protein